MTNPSRHSLLLRQLKGHYGPEGPPAEVSDFVAAVDEAYRQFDDDRLMLERSLDLSSQELFEANAELRALFQALPDTVLRIAPDGTILDVKAGAAEGLLLDRAQMVGRRLQDAPAIARGKSFGTLVREVTESGRMGQLEYSLHIRGDERSFEARIIPFHGKQLLVVIRDITEQERAVARLREAKTLLEERVAERTQELRKVNQALREEMAERATAEERRRSLEATLLQTQKLEGLGLLAGGIAHDFNNLLLAILGNASLAREECPPGSQAHLSLEEVEAAAKQASALTNQMLAYSGKGRFLVQPVDISAIAEEMTGLLSVSVSKKARVEYQLSRDLPPVEADATQVGQVVMNLVTNASEAMGAEGGNILIRTDTVVLSDDDLADSLLGQHARPGTFVRFEVSDDGHGMAPDTVEKIFDPFFTTKDTGRGLGLAAVFGIVRAHNGAIRLSTAQENGTRFTVYLPASGEHAPIVPKPEPAETNKGAVLIVDDDPRVLKLLRRVLERHRYRVLTAGDGRDGVGVFQRHWTDIRCVVLDMTMPVMDGPQALAEIRTISRDVAVILVSGFSQEHVAPALEGEGHIEFLQKPFSPNELVRRVEAATCEPGAHLQVRSTT